MAEREYMIEEELNFIETDAEVTLSRLIENFEEFTGDVLHPGDERRIFIQMLAYVIANTDNHINETGRGNLIRYASGREVDEIAQIFQSPRLEAEYATVTMQITFSESMEHDLTLPKGTRVTADGIHLFAIDEDVVLEAGSTTLTREVTATATETGTGHNDFAIGQINRIVDTNPYVYTVSNIDSSKGGTDLEDDESYKERLRIAPFTFAVAGPSESYRAIALSVSNQIGDVHVYSPSAGVVEIVVIFKNGVIPEADDEIFTEILEACSARTVRPLTDYVQAVPASSVEIGINLSYYVPNDDITVMPAIIQAIEDYKTWQTEKIGRAVNPDYLRKLLMNAGAARVEITSPVYQELEEYQIAKVTSTSATFSGSITM